MVTDSNIRSLCLIKMDNIPPWIIRQPPSPLKPAARKEGNTNPEMVGANLRSCKRRSCKRKRSTDIESLPDEVLFDVLVRLPAHDIYDSARLVCSKWYHVTRTHTFISAHLQRSTYGLLFQSIWGDDSFFMAVGESGRVEISKLSYELRGPLMVSCNGLLLEFERGSTYNFYVLNPATRQIFTLPSIVGYTLVYEIFAIAYAAASMEYKAVVLFFPGRGKKRMCFIITVGVDNSWRTIGKESVSLAATQMFVSAPLITEGFVHFYHIASNEVLTLNVETEIITETSGPAPEGYRRNIYLSTGRYLSLLRPCGKFCWEVWEMKPKIDYRWRKVWDISLEAYKFSTFKLLGYNEYDEYLFPVGWLKYLEILVFKSYTTRSQIFVYNLITYEIITIDLRARNCEYNLVGHKDSLVSLDGC